MRFLQMAWSFVALLSFYGALSNQPFLITDSGAIIYAMITSVSIVLIFKPDPLSIILERHHRDTDN